MARTQLDLVEVATQNLPRMFVGLIPFSREIEAELPIIGKNYIPYGSTLLTTIGLERRWSGLYFNDKVFTYENAARNRKDMLNAEHILTAKDAIKLIETFEDDEDIFIRPSQDLKHFSGQVINTKECIAWFKDAMACDMSGTYKIDEDLMVVLAEPKTIQAEWRWFIVGGKVISGSMYRAHGQMNKEKVIEETVIREAQTFADGWLPHENCVMDLALVDGKMKVIEFNCINSSGFYDHDIPAVFDALYRYSTK